MPRASRVRGETPGDRWFKRAGGTRLRFGMSIPRYRPRTSCGGPPSRPCHSFRSATTRQPYVRLIEVGPSVSDGTDSDSQVATFIVDGPGGPTLGRLSMDRVRTSIGGFEPMLN